MVLPVYARADWQVETVWADLGTGLREWIEIQHGDQRHYCATAAERDNILGSHALNLRDFTETDTIEDGCE